MPWHENCTDHNARSEYVVQPCRCSQQNEDGNERERRWWACPRMEHSLFHVMLPTCSILGISPRWVQSTPTVYNVSNMLDTGRITTLSSVHSYCISLLLLSPSITLSCFGATSRQVTTPVRSVPKSILFGIVMENFCRPGVLILLPTQQHLKPISQLRLDYDMTIPRHIRLWWKWSKLQ